MSDEKLKEKLTIFLDQDPRKWVKSAFYSDPAVVQMIDNLYCRWEDTGRQGLPVDYASHEELVLLWNTASKYLGMSDNMARALVFNRMNGIDDKTLVRKKGVFSRLFGRA
ncbi:MAG: hypothetical protein F7B60_07495 [Desulfurococcales archaeon]|nr:hypothetical protein [Desulfurococcales archaeon]